jgi:hypothetical protein
MPKPDYKRAVIELSKILKATEKRRGISSKSSETAQVIKDGGWVRGMSCPHIF